MDNSMMCLWSNSFGSHHLTLGHMFLFFNGCAHPTKVEQLIMIVVTLGVVSLRHFSL
jgi:hypothetical protein